MRICFTTLFRDKGIVDAASFINRSIIFRELPRALVERGHCVDVVVSAPADERLKWNGVNYFFVQPGIIAQRTSEMLDRQQRGGRLHEPALRCARLIRSLEPAVIHFYGTVLHLNLWLLSRTIDTVRTPLLVHYHGGRPARKIASRALQRSSFRGVSRFLFPTLQHAVPFVEAGMVEPSRVIPFISTSSVFTQGLRSEARLRTSMHGSPVFVSTGRLHPVKDPITALSGFEAICRSWPESRFYMYYTSDELMADVRTRIDRSPELKARVELRGRADGSEMEAIYQSADFFVQASVDEVSGFALAEAMACGTIPLVTDIPSFSGMTDEGRAGILFPPGSAAAMAEAALKVSLEDIPSLSQRVRRRFEEVLSFPAMARQLDQVYSGLFVR